MALGLEHNHHMLDAMKRLALVVAALMIVAACTDAEDNTPAPRNAPPVTSAGPVSEPVPTAGTGTKYAAVEAPCATINGRAGTKLPSSQDTAAAATARCAYAEQPGQVKVNSSATIAKTSDASQLYKSAVGTANTDRVDGVATKPRGGLGDEAVLVTRFDDHTTELFVRSGNALIQTSATIPPQMDRESELLQLQRQEGVLTELARSLLAQLR